MKEKETGASYGTVDIGLRLATHEEKEAVAAKGKESYQLPFS